MQHRHVFSLLVGLLALLVADGCREKEDAGVLRREGDPNYIEDFDDERMDAAIAEARATLGTFVAALDKRVEGAEGFAVKMGFKYGTEGTEFIWITDVRREGDTFVGVVGNEPVNAVGVSLGETVRVARREVADWMYTSNERLRGGYTIVALIHGTPDAADQAEAMGIDWTAYRFLDESR